MQGEWIVVTIAGRRLAIAFPDTVLEEHESLRDKTMKIGQIARMCSVFGVDTVQIFRDPRGRGESSLIRHVLEYLETPAVSQEAALSPRRFAAIRGPPPASEDSFSQAQGPACDGSRPGNSARVSYWPTEALSDVGLDSPLALRQKLGGDKRVTVRITSVAPLAGVVVDRSETTEYWGYTVEVRGAEEVMTDHRFGLKLATSRLGDPLSRCLPSFRRSSAALRA